MNADTFDPDEFLAEVRKRIKPADIARVIDQPSSRVADFWKPPGQGKRVLTMKEGVKLAEALGMWPCEPVSAENLTAILRVCLKYPPASGWTDEAVQRLAESVADGLELLRKLPASPPSQDAIDLAAALSADRLRGKPA